jgi:hypothetical protein
MSQPPYPPPGGNDHGGGWSRSRDRGAAGGGDPTWRFDHPPSDGQWNATQQFGHPQYVQPQYVQAPYPEYSEPRYGTQDGQAPYGQAPYGQAPYGQAPYTPYGQPAHGPWGPPGGPGGPPPRTNRNTLIALVAGAVLVVAVLGAGLVVLLRAGDATPEAATSSEFSRAAEGSAPAGERGMPGPAVTPDGLGDDPYLDELAQGCYQGDMASCDDLYEQAELDSLYALYGGTCAGRQDVVDADTVFCTTAFPED